MLARYPDKLIPLLKLVQDNVETGNKVMGNAIPTHAEQDDPEVNSYLTLYKYVVPVIACFIVSINLTVVISSGLLIKKKVEPRFTYFFLGNVAVTDMIIGISMLFGQYYPKEYRTHKICTIQNGLLVSSAISSIYSVGLLGVDRFLYIVYGIKYCKWISIIRVRVVIAFTWLFSLLIGFLPSMGWAGDTMNGRICWFIVVAPDALIILTVSIGIVPVILVIILYSIILYHALANIRRIKYSVYTISEQLELREHLRKFKGHIEVPMKIYRKRSSVNGIPNKWKAIKIVLFTTASFLITWAPYFFACVCYVAYKCDFNNPSSNCKTLKLLIASPLTLLGFTNSLINPLIYAWWHHGFRAYVKRRLKICCCR